MQSVCQVNWSYFRQAQLNILNIPLVRALGSHVFDAAIMSTCLNLTKICCICLLITGQY